MNAVGTTLDRGTTIRGFRGMKACIILFTRAYRLSNGGTRKNGYHSNSSVKYSSKISFFIVLRCSMSQLPFLLKLLASPINPGYGFLRLIKTSGDITEISASRRLKRSVKLKRSLKSPNFTVVKSECKTLKQQWLNGGEDRS